MFNRQISSYFGIVLLVCTGPARGAEPNSAKSDAEAVAILKRACFECHGRNKQDGELRLDSREAILQGGSNGAAIDVGQVDASELLRRISLDKNDSDSMPQQGELLAPAEIKKLAQWIARGAPWSESVNEPHWSYVAPARPVPPMVAGQLYDNPIDAFIAERHQQSGMGFADQEESRVLCRRIYLDVIGLPPQVGEVEQFHREAQENITRAVEKLVDRLLAWPQYGEKWARPWLDAARYADSHGFQRDDLRDLWAYRDWVIRSLNDDMPFDQFTIEQLAGDLLPNATESQRIATGFNRCAPCNVEAGTDPEENRFNQIVDRVNTLGYVWLGTSLECAQCHDHKYDPFSRKDYYGLFAYFNQTAIEADRSNPNVPGSIRFIGPYLNLAGEERAKTEEISRNIARLKQQLAIGSPTNERGEITRLRTELAQLEYQQNQLQPTKTLVMEEIQQPRVSTMYARGDFRNPSEQIEPSTPKTLHALDPRVPRNRLGLAQWLVDGQNPLVARVVVNRMWAEVFGAGLVSTPEDFGLKGEPPSHPELLDWLAVEFMECNWSQKSVLRAILTSQTYRQSSRITPSALANDPHNVWLARGPRFRLPAESVRDNALALAGLLSHKQFGPPIRPPQPAGLWTKVGGDRYDYQVSPGEDEFRRGIYIVLKRMSPYPSLINFDATARLACRVKRSRSNTPLQALTLLNDPVYVRAARELAERVQRELPTEDVDAQLRYAFQITVSRIPQLRELAALRQLFDEECAHAESMPLGESNAIRQAWFAVASTLLNLDETITKE